ncbi:putative Type IV secretory pathway, protease TraF [Burkholderiales bacterium GJ-E10]|nr:putative Type IV secretory pathway, protease TraF [Burkholderiales bacterium GJ-E10]
MLAAICRSGSRRRRAWWLLVAVLALAGMRAGAGILGGMGWRVNFTESEPLGFYRLEPVGPGTPIARGAMVEFCPPAGVTPADFPFYARGDCPGGGMPMFKQVAGIPGDRIRVSMASIAVNGVVLPFSSQITHSQKWPWVRLRHQAGEFTLGRDQYWLYGSGARPALAAQSFDSRYWGPADRAEIRRVAR